MKEIANAICKAGSNIGDGLLIAGLFLGLGTCNQKHPVPKTDFQYCRNLSEKDKVICLQELKQINNKGE